MEVNDVRKSEVVVMKVRICKHTLLITIAVVGNGSTMRTEDNIKQYIFYLVFGLSPLFLFLRCVCGKGGGGGR